MSSMRDRQEGFEKKFAMDEESKFKAMARRNKLFGYGPLKNSAKPARIPTPMRMKWCARISRKQGTTTSSARYAPIWTQLASHRPTIRFAAL